MKNALYNCVVWTLHKDACLGMRRAEIYKVETVRMGLRLGVGGGGAFVFAQRCCQLSKPQSLGRIDSARHLIVIHSPKCGLFLIFREKQHKLPQVLSSSLNLFSPKQWNHLLSSLESSKASSDLYILLNLFLFPQGLQSKIWHSKVVDIFF